MKIWGISDTHFSNSQTCDFGPIWTDHTTKIIRNWQSAVREDDLVLVGGDITWAYNLEKGMPDIHLLNRLPGKAKILIKGNHDHWWEKYSSLCDAVPKGIKPMEGNAIRVEGQVFCGTRGWVSPNDPDFDMLDMKTFKKELGLLQRALDLAMVLKPVDGIHLLMHFPPFTSNGFKTPFYEMQSQYPVVTCTYGHFHLKKEWDRIPQGRIDGTDFQLTSTDFLNHMPALIWEN
ncbi:MAG: hypothetical protein GY866_25150 [Proteobacteria bacterium]|nr:hypothetical protein [Pseudomonadota bacterium]